jgi:hypothetical protein
MDVSVLDRYAPGEGVRTIKVAFTTALGDWVLLRMADEASGLVLHVQPVRVGPAFLDGVKSGGSDGADD